MWEGGFVPDSADEYQNEEERGECKRQDTGPESHLEGAGEARGMWVQAHDFQSW